jgi:uncharacterized protein YaiI (UPF0178 family)
VISSPAPQPKIIAIYVDAGACQVKPEVYRVAKPHALKGVELKIFVLSNSPAQPPSRRTASRWDSIGMALATRNRMDSLRSADSVTGGPKPFVPRDRSTPRWSDSSATGSARHG